MSIEDWKITRVACDGLDQLAPGLELPAKSLLFDEQWVKSTDPDTGEPCSAFVGPSWTAARDVEIVVDGPKSEVLQIVVHGQDEHGWYVLGIKPVPGPGSRMFQLRGPGRFALAVNVGDFSVVGKVAS